MKNVLFVLLSLSLGINSYGQDTAICDIPSKSGGLYLMPKGIDIARVPKDTEVMLILSSGDRKLCRLDHDVYPFIKKIAQGKFIATDLRNGQKVLRPNGMPFEVIMGIEDD